MNIIVVGALATFLLTVLLVPTLRPLAVRIGLLDRPDGRRWHAKATPSVGGLAILLAAAPVCLFLLPVTRQIEGLGLAAVVIVAAGVADDRFRIRWQYRLCAQVLAALVLIYVGGIRVENIGQVFGFQVSSLGVLSTPLTVLATVGIVNAVNMADGVDGLAGGISLVAIVMLTGAAVYAGNLQLANDLGLVVGALCGFLLFNVRTPWRPRATVFLGNAGAELLGLLIASACFRLTQNAHHPVGAQLAPFLVAPALIDCLTLMLRRIRSGVSPFVGDRNHLHHLLLDGGWSATAIVGSLVAATLLIGAGAALALKAHMPPELFSLAFVAMWGAYFLATHRREKSVAAFARIAHQARSILVAAPAQPPVRAPAPAFDVATRTREDTPQMAVED
ncbi:MAG: MraY family glycosyltransferase [Caulobacterales bacterium]